MCKKFYLVNSMRAPDRYNWFKREFKEQIQNITDQNIEMYMQMEAKLVVSQDAREDKETSIRQERICMYLYKNSSLLSAT